MARKPPKKAEFPLLDHVESLVAKLHEHVPAALERFDADDIHQARVATRRLKAAVDLMEPVLSKRYRKPVADGFKRLRRRLGPLRDADVMIDHLCELQKEGKHAAAAAWLRLRLEADRQALRKKSQEGASTGRELRRIDRWPNVRAEIAEGREAVDGLLAESLHLQADAFAEQANWLIEDLEGVEDGDDRKDVRQPRAKARGAKAAADVDGRRANGRSDDDEDDAAAGTADVEAGAAAPALPRARQNPHDLRIAGKALRYTLEMADAEGHSPGAGVMKQFKRMQELLGDWHDYVVLADRAMQEVVTAELAHQDAAAAERVIDLARHAVRRSAIDLSAFAKLWRQQGEKLTARIRAAFPLTHCKSVQSGDPSDPREPSGSAAGPTEDPGLPPGAIATDANAPRDACDASTGPGTGPDPDSTRGPEVPAAARTEESPAV